MSLVTNMLAEVQRFNKEILGVTVPDKPTRLRDDRFGFRFDHLT